MQAHLFNGLTDKNCIIEAIIETGQLTCCDENFGF